MSGRAASAQTRDAGATPSPVDCPLCGPSPWRRWRRHAGWTIVRCRGCGLLVTWPRPSESELRALYEAGRYYEERDMGAAAADAWLERAREFLMRVPLHVSRAVDVGAGEGHAVAALRSLGIAADGVEPSATARATAHERHGLTLAADLGQVKSEACDLVTFIHSLEHVANPVGALREAAGCLRPEGYVFIEVPHAGTVELWTHRGRDHVLHLPAHLYHFTPRTLARIVERAGLQVVNVQLANPAWLERLFVARARRRALARPGGSSTAPGPCGGGRQAASAVPTARRGPRRFWADVVLPGLRRRFPGYKFQLLARRPAIRSDVTRSQ